MDFIAIVAAAAIGASVAAAEPRTVCDELLKRLDSRIADTTCVETVDLTTNNPSTTPADNSLPGLPPFAFTPRTDRAVISPDAAHKTPITHAVPGVQLQSRIVNDPAGEARRLVRLSDNWNGRLVVAGASGTRSEFSGQRPLRTSSSFTYAVGTSNGGYQVRRAIESAPEFFDGGVDWEGTFVDPVARNILTDLPPAVLNFPGYAASGFNANSTGAQNIVAAGYPPDIVVSGQPLWARYSAQFWEVTLCQWQNAWTRRMTLTVRAPEHITTWPDYCHQMSDGRSPQSPQLGRSSDQW